MRLGTKLVDSNFPEMHRLDRLNNEAFPEDERIPTVNLIELAEAKKIDLLAVYDAEKFIGFIVMFIHEQYAYMFFLAIDSSLRSKGYGSNILSLIEDIYANYTITLDLEKIDSSASNNRQRLARKNFYLRNGYRETGYLLDYLNNTFEVLCMGTNFDKEKYAILLKNVVRTVGNQMNQKLDMSLYLKGD